MSIETQEVKDGWIMFVSDGWKIHWVHSSLLPGLMEDSAERGHPNPGHEPVEKGFIDNPGMILQDRSHEVLEVDGFLLTIPSEDFRYFYESLKKKTERTFNDGRKYFKIHGWLHCVVFTPEQRDACLALMEARLPEAEKRSKADTDRFKAAINEINKDGVKVISAKAPDSIPKVPLAGKPNNEKN